jgi:hypothetical protein
MASPNLGLPDRVGRAGHDVKTSEALRLDRDWVLWPFALVSCDF